MKKIINQAGGLFILMAFALSANAMDIVVPIAPTAPTPPTAPTVNVATTTTATTTSTSTEATTSMVKVYIDKFVDGVHATAANSGSQSFKMFTTYNSTTTGSGSGNYYLNTAGYSPTFMPYQAMTINMESGASYATNEVIGENVVTTCATGTNATSTFMLSGYSWGDSYSQAVTAAHSTTSPSFTNLASDKYVIVWNTKCNVANGGGQIGGEVTGGATSTGVFAVTSVDTVNGVGTADGTFTNGWKYLFHITVPTNETNLSMKFADWMSLTGSTTIPVANNMRISSLQASSTTPILVTASNTYTIPTLNMTVDLDMGTVGKQVQVLIETLIPINSVNGSYSTNYGIKTN